MDMLRAADWEGVRSCSSGFVEQPTLPGGHPAEPSSSARRIKYLALRLIVLVVAGFARDGAWGMGGEGRAEGGKMVSLRKMHYFESDHLLCIQLVACDVQSWASG